MTEATSATPAPDALASVLADAPFVRLVATDDGDALAATGVLARALRATGTPFQARIASDPTDEAVGDEVAVTVGSGRGPHAIPGSERPASTAAFAVARSLGVDPDPVVALAGVVAAGSVPGTDGSGDALDAAKRGDRVARRPGVGLPVADGTDTGDEDGIPRAESLAASTLVSTRYSGDPDAAARAIAPLELPADPNADDRRRLASLVAVDAVDDASERAAAAVERALRPYATDGPFETVGGYADVLDALAREAPGTGIALALAADPDGDLRAAALDAWRRHGLAAHRAVDAATVDRYDGCVVARVDGSPTDASSVLPTVARLVRDFRSPEPVAVAVDEAAGRLAAASVEPVGLGDACRTAAAAVDGDGWGTGARGGLAVSDERTDAGASAGATALTTALAALREAV